MRVLLGILGVFAVILLLAGCGDGSEDETVTSEPTHTSYGNLPSTTADLDRRAVYDEAAEVLEDRSLSYSDRRNRLRLVRRSFGDDLFSPLSKMFRFMTPERGKRSRSLATWPT